MIRRTATVLTSAAAVCAALAFAPAATAGNVAWNVSVGGPGFAVSAGQPGYWGVNAWRPGVAAPYYRPWHRPVVAAPLAYPVPVAYPAPVLYPRPAAVPFPVPYWRHHVRPYAAPHAGDHGGHHAPAPHGRF